MKAPSMDFISPNPGQLAIRKCGCYWEYCDGCCNSCEKNEYYTSNHTTLSKHSTYTTGDSTAPSSSLWG